MLHTNVLYVGLQIDSVLVLYVYAHTHIYVCRTTEILFAEQPVPGDQYKSFLHIQVPDVIFLLNNCSTLYHSLRFSVELIQILSVGLWLARHK